MEQTFIEEYHKETRDFRRLYVLRGHLSIYGPRDLIRQVCSFQQQQSASVSSHLLGQQCVRGGEQSIPVVESLADKDCMGDRLGLVEIGEARDRSLLKGSGQGDGLKGGGGAVGSGEILEKLSTAILVALDLALTVMSHESGGSDGQLVESAGADRTLQELAATASHVAKVVVAIGEVVIACDLAVALDFCSAASVGAVEDLGRVEDVVLSVMTREVVDIFIAKVAMDHLGGVGAACLGLGQVPFEAIPQLCA